MLWLLGVFLLLGLLIWANAARGMSLGDRMDIALEIVQTSNFSVAEGYEDAAKEDPDLVGWIKAGKDCVMLFQSEMGGQKFEIVDFASDSFHPGLVVHYLDGSAVRTSSGEPIEGRAHRLADELLKQVHLVVVAAKGQEDFGYRC